MKTTCIDKLYVHLFIHIIKYIHVFLRTVFIICIRHTHPCVSTYVSMDIFIISPHLAIEAFRGSEPRISPRHLLGYGYFFFSGRKKQKNKQSLLLHIQGPLHEGDRESWRSLKNKMSQSCICCCPPPPPISQWQLLCGGGISPVRCSEWAAAMVGAHLCYPRGPIYILKVFS